MREIQPTVTDKQVLVTHVRSDCLLGVLENVLVVSSTQSGPVQGQRRHLLNYLDQKVSKSAV